MYLCSYLNLSHGVQNTSQGTMRLIPSPTDGVMMVGILDYDWLDRNSRNKSSRFECENSFSVWSCSFREYYLLVPFRWPRMGKTLKVMQRPTIFYFALFVISSTVFCLLFGSSLFTKIDCLNWIHFPRNGIALFSILLIKYGKPQQKTAMASKKEECGATTRIGASSLVHISP